MLEDASCLYFGCAWGCILTLLWLVGCLYSYMLWICVNLFLLLNLLALLHFIKLSNTNIMLVQRYSAATLAIQKEKKRFYLKLEIKPEKIIWIGLAEVSSKPSKIQINDSIFISRTLTVTSAIHFFFKKISIWQFEFICKSNFVLSLKVSFRLYQEQGFNCCWH